MDFSNYIFRSHMVGSIINVPKPLTKNQQETLIDYRKRARGEGRPLTENQDKVWHSLETKLNESKEYKLTDGQKKILREEVYKYKYGIKSTLIADSLEKGLYREKEARDLLCFLLKDKGVLLTSDPERRSNEWVTGKRDIKSDKRIIDIKVAMSKTSFSKMLDVDYKENENNKCQIDSYMDLWGLKEGVICHALMDTPEYMIHNLIRKSLRHERLFNHVTNEFTDDGMEYIRGIVSDNIITEEVFDWFINTEFIISEFHGLSYTFSRNDFKDWNEIPINERIHMIPHNYDPIRIEERNECIKIAREYMNTVKPINNIINL